jgi:hypothetical protein
MRAEVKLFALLVPFFALMLAVYAYFTRLDEWVGIIGFLLTMMFCVFIAGYLWLSGRKLDLRPEDNLEGEISDQSGDYGHFAPYSWQPLWLGLAISVATLGVAVGWWLVVVSAPFLVIAIVGWTFEFFRGEKAV